MRKLQRLLDVEIILTLLVIVGGAFVRATGSGAGCGEHWPLCNGTAIPIHPRLETIIEFTHRLTSGSSLLVFVVLFFMARKSLPPEHPTRRWSRLALASFVLEALIGAVLVLKKLVAADTSWLRAFVISGHLVNTLLLLAGLVAMRLGLRRNLSPLSTKWRWLLSGWVLVGAMGAVVALGDTLFPAGSLAEGWAQDFGTNAHPIVKFRFVHPFLALLVSAFTMIVTHDDRDGLLLRFLIVGQVLGGVLNWILLAPLWMQLVHLLLADITWMVVVAAALNATPVVTSSSADAATPPGARS